MESNPPSTLEEYLNSLPEFKSGDRIESLYSDFSSSRQSNPAGFHSNNSTWQMIITDILKYGLQPTTNSTSSTNQTSQDAPDRLILHLNQQFLESLRRPNVGKPYGLACPLWTLSSFSNSHSSSTFAPLSTFISAGGWGPSTGLTTTITRSISWVSRSLTRGSLFDPDQRFDQFDLDQKLDVVKIDWVNLLLLHQAADRVIERYQGSSGLSPSLDCLYTRSQFKDQLTGDIFPSTRPNLKLSEADLRVLIKHLERDRRVLVHKKDAIKFVLPGFIETDRDGKKYSTVGPSPINELDRGILSVKQTIQQLNQQIQSIEIQIEQRTQEAKKYVQLSQPEMASTKLKSRKELRRVLTQRIDVLETLNGVYLKIEQASTDVEIMNAYVKSTNTLKGLLSNPSLKTDRVERTMENLQGVLADQKEIEDVINESSAQNVTIDDQEIAAELASLIQDQPSSPLKIPPQNDVMVDLESRLHQLKVPKSPSPQLESNLPSSSHLDSDPQNVPPSLKKNLSQLISN